MQLCSKDIASANLRLLIENRSLIHFNLVDKLYQLIFIFYFNLVILGYFQILYLKNILEFFFMRFYHLNQFFIRHQAHHLLIYIIIRRLFRTSQFIFIKLWLKLHYYF